MGCSSVIVLLTISFFTAASITSPSPLSSLVLNMTRTDDSILTVTLSLGTPPTEVILLMDTGSPLTWTQCQPCTLCFNQSVPYYDSAASETFGRLSCTDDRVLTDPDNIFTCTNDTASFSIGYGDGSVVTEGIASTETLLFPDGTSAAGVMFGCAKKADPISASGVVSGLMGLSRAGESLLAQLFPPSKRIFSYCFSPFGDGKSRSTTAMTFGDRALAVVPAETRLFQTSFAGSDLYELLLEDLSVGDRRLGLPEGTFSPGGAVIDSGTQIPMIPGEVYEAVTGLFDEHYASLGLEKMNAPPEMEPMKLCYRKPDEGFNRHLSLTYHLVGADYIVDGSYTVVVDGGSYLFCVAVQPGSSMILGAWHQQNTRLVYDAAAGALSFGQEVCV